MNNERLITRLLYVMAVLELQAAAQLATNTSAKSEKLLNQNLS